MTFAEFNAQTGFETKAGFQLTPLQVEDIEQFVQWRKSLNRYEVGTGKTVISTVVSLMSDVETTIVCVPPILLLSWENWLNKVSERTLRYQGSPKVRKEMKLLGNRWVLMSHAIFRIDFEKLMKVFEGVSMEIIIDECFVAGTKILTPKGEVSIELLKVGDMVLNSFGQFPVQKVFNRVSSDLYTLGFNNGKSFTCTGNHPVFTDLGWVAARNCRGRRLLPNPDLRVVQSPLRKTYKYFNARSKQQNRNGTNLFKILRNEATSAVTPRDMGSLWTKTVRENCYRLQISRNSQRAFIRGSQTSGFSNIESKRSRPFSQRRERNRPNTLRSYSEREYGNSRFRVEPISSFRDLGRRSSTSLQARLRAQRIDDSCRNRRQQSQSSVTKSAGLKENGKTPGTGLECVQVIQQAGAREVWNIEVAGCPNYFAGGVLVHNCQAIKNPKAKLYTCIGLMSKNRRLQMLSGTPTSRPLDCYTYIRLKSPDLYRSYAHFEHTHIAEKDFFGSVTAYQNLDILADNFALKSILRTKEEVHGYNNAPLFPDTVYELSKDHMDLYEQLVEEQLLLLDDGTKIDATTAQRLYHALQQIIVNYDYFSGDATKRSTAYDLIDSVVEQTDCDNQSKSKLIIWTIYKRTSRNVLTYLNNQGHKAVGAYSEVNSAKSFVQFMEDPTTRILVAQPLSAGSGLNPQSVCWESLAIETSTVPMLARQANGRLDRMGQLHKPSIRYAVANKTVQVTLLEKLLQADELVQKVERSKISLRKELYGDTS